MTLLDDDETTPTEHLLYETKPTRFAAATRSKWGVCIPVDELRAYMERATQALGFEPHQAKRCVSYWTTTLARENKPLVCVRTVVNQFDLVDALVSTVRVEEGGVTVVCPFRRVYFVFAPSDDLREDLVAEDLDNVHAADGQTSGNGPPSDSIDLFEWGGQMIDAAHF